MPSADLCMVGKIYMPTTNCFFPSQNFYTTRSRLTKPTQVHNPLSLAVRASINLNETVQLCVLCYPTVIPRKTSCSSSTRPGLQLCPRHKKNITIAACWPYKSHHALPPLLRCSDRSSKLSARQGSFTTQTPPATSTPPSSLYPSA